MDVEELFTICLGATYDLDVSTASGQMACKRQNHCAEQRKTKKTKNLVKNRKHTADVLTHRQGYCRLF